MKYEAKIEICSQKCRNKLQILRGVWNSKRIRKKPDSALWLKPLHQQQCQFSGRLFSTEYEMKKEEIWLSPMKKVPKWIWPEKQTFPFGMTQCKCSLDSFQNSAKRWNWRTRLSSVIRSWVSVMPDWWRYTLQWSCPRMSFDIRERINSYFKRKSSYRPYTLLQDGFKCWHIIA